MRLTEIHCISSEKVPFSHPVMSRYAMKSFLEGEIILKFCLLSCLRTGFAWP